MSPVEVIDYHSTVGYRLRHAREQLSFSLRDVAGALNLLVTHVRAIEANRCDALAADEKFVRHVHDYANLVELDANEVVDTYREQSAAIEPMQPLPAANKRFRRGAWIFAGALAILCMSAAGWLFTPIIFIMPGHSAPLRSDKAEVNQPQQRTAIEQTALVTSIENTHADNLPTDAESTGVIPRMIDERAVDSKNKRAVGETGVRPERVAVEPNQQQTAIAASATPPNSRAPTAASDQLRSNEWFTSLDPDRFTLQVLSLTKETSARAFIRRRQLENKAAYFAVRRNDKTLYAVTFGLYNSFQAAQSAGKLLPDSIKHLKPWVRNTGRIQQSMLR